MTATPPSRAAPGPPWNASWACWRSTTRASCGPPSPTGRPTRRPRADWSAMAVPPEDRPSFAPIRVDASIWALDANPGRIEAAANAWRSLATATGDVGDDLNSESRTLLGSDWAGDARDTFAA